MLNTTLIRFLPQKKMRFLFYKGDYYYSNGVLHIDICDTGNLLLDRITAVHELIEVILTEAEGITEKKILEFDKQFEEECKAGHHNEDAEPGDSIDAPYVFQHQFAELVEKMMLNFLKRNTNG